MQVKAECDGQKKKKKLAMYNIFVVWRKLLEGACCKASLEAHKENGQQEEEDKEEGEQDTICSTLVVKFINIAERFRVFRGCQRTSAGDRTESCV